MNNPSAAELALRRALRLLEARARSRHEIFQRLSEAEFEKDVIESVVQRLEELGLLNDADFAQEYVRQAVDRGQSAEWIRRSMLQRGVDQSVVQAAVDELGVRDSEHDRALELARRRAARITDLAPARAYGRLVRYLCNRGYDVELAAEVSGIVVGGD